MSRMETPEQTREQLMTEIETLQVQIEKLKEIEIKAEAARQHAHDEMERKVREKTIQLNRINERLQAKLTKEKRTDTALRESENYYRTIFENTGTATMIIDKDLKISMVNKKFEELSGYSEGECLGKTPFAFVVPEEAVKVQKNYRLRKLDPDKAPPNYEVKCFDKQGTVKECIFSVSIVPHSDYIVASLLDVTAQHQAEEALKHRVDSQDLLLETSKYFTGMVADDIDDMINYTLRMVGKFDHNDRSFVFLLSNDETTVSNTHEYYRNGQSKRLAFRNIFWVDGQITAFRTYIYFPGGRSANRSSC